MNAGWIMTFAALAVPALSPPALSPLRCQGKDFVDAAGHKVALRGVNLGGWLVEEIWMTPFSGSRDKGGPKEVRDHMSLWRTVEQRVGRKAMERVRAAYRHAWISEGDFARIRSAGFNHVRVPFLSSLMDEPGGIAQLRQAVDMAKRHGLYTVLDLHGAPGGQSGEHHTGEAGRNRLWFDVENIDRLVEVWTRVGREFAKEPAVAAYDLMNEPMGAPNPAMLHLVYDRVVRAVRKVAPGKVVFVDDGYKGFETTPHPDLAGWSNVGFSLHFYNFDAKSSDDHGKSLGERMPKLIELQGYRDAPVYAGEFNVEPHGTPEATRGVIQHFEEAGWSWCLWTYKTAAVEGPMGQWGLFRLPKPADAIDPFRDDEATMLAKAAKVRTELMESAPGVVEMLKRRFGLR